MVLVLDNYDSFTYNLVQYIRGCGHECVVHRNDQVSVSQVAALRPQHIVISPGPGTPENAGICIPLIQKMAGNIPILGVCLGHQAIGSAFGAKIVRAPRLMHGKTSPVAHDGRGVFRGLPSPLNATRYHSLVVEETSLPGDIEVSARSADDGMIMGMRHRRLPVEGVQFHPESVMTDQGMSMVENFLRQAS